MDGGFAVFNHAHIVHIGTSSADENSKGMQTAEGGWEGVRASAHWS